MANAVNAMNYWTNAVQVGCVMAEAQGVVAMRVMGAFGIWSVPASENTRMLDEKVVAFFKGTTDASRAAIAGKSPDEVTAAAIKPIRKATYSNHKRLTKRGLRRT